jgi:hypothetical protein
VGYFDGTLKNAIYGYPFYITKDIAGNLYISDNYYLVEGDAFSVRRISLSHDSVTTIAGGTGYFQQLLTVALCNNGTECDLQLNLLTSGGSWCYGDRVTPSPSNWPPLRQSGKIAQFNYPTGLALSSYGQLMFVADTGQNLIRQIYCAEGQH